MGVRLGVDIEWGVGFRFFRIVGDAGGAVKERGGGCARDLSDTSSPSFRTESQYSKLPSADKKK